MLEAWGGARKFERKRGVAESQEQDFGVGGFFADCLNNLLDARDNGVGRIFAKPVGKVKGFAAAGPRGAVSEASIDAGINAADTEDDDLGLDAVEFARG